MPAQFTETIYFAETVTFAKPPVIPALTFGNTQANANDPIAGNKTYHRYRKEFGQPKAATNVTERRVVHVAKSAGTVNEFKATVSAALTGAAAATVDLLKNGVSVLSGAVAFSSADVAFALKTGTVVTQAYAAGDVFEIAHTVTLGGGGAQSGLTGQAEFEELP